jgi:hypothetical protein
MHPLPHSRFGRSDGMNPPSPPDIEQVVTLVGTIFASISLGVGLVLLFVGVKLIRAIYTVAFTFVGAAAGLVVGHLYFPQFMWVAGVAGAVIVGMVGFLFYRIWIMLTFGAVLAVIGGSSWYLATSQGELASLWTQGESLTRDYAEVAGATVEMQRKLLELKMQPPDQGQMTESKKSQLENMDKASGALAQLSEKLEANPSPDEAARLLADAVDKIKAAGLGEQAEYLRFAQAAAKMQSLPRRQQELRDEAGRMLPAQALGASIAAAVGLTLGLIIAGASWRFADRDGWSEVDDAGNLCADRPAPPRDVRSLPVLRAPGPAAARRAAADGAGRPGAAGAKRRKSGEGGG